MLCSALQHLFLFGPHQRSATLPAIATKREARDVDLALRLNAYIPLVSNQHFLGGFVNEDGRAPTEQTTPAWGSCQTHGECPAPARPLR